MNAEDIFDGIEPVEVPAKNGGKQKGGGFVPYQNQEQKPMPVDVEKLKVDNKAFLAYGGDVNDEVKNKLMELIPKLNMNGYKLRTRTMGTTEFCRMFENAIMIKEVYLPWPKFNSNVTDPVLARPTDMAFDVACWVTINTIKNITVDDWNGYKPVRKTFIANEIHLFLGKELDTKPGFIIIDTPCGSTRFTRDTKYDEIDFQTKAAMRYAKLFDIKLYNVRNKDSMEELEIALEFN